MPAVPISHHLSDVLPKVEHAPLFPPNVARLLEAAERPDTRAAEVVALLDEEPALIPEVLRLANSPVYSLRTIVSSAGQAARLLGVKAVRDLACTSALLSMFDPHECESTTQLWRHSVCTALAARAMGRHLGIESASDVFVAGIMHDVGKFVIQHAAPKAQRRIVDVCQRKGVSFREAERAVIGVDHTEIASAACRHWRLPTRVAACARYHHDPQASPITDLAVAQAVTTVHIADWLAHRILDDFQDVHDSEYQWLLDFERRAPVVERAADEAREQLADLEGALGLGATDAAA